MKHIFLCSTPRSGTTLFLHLLDIGQPIGQRIATYGEALYAPIFFEKNPKFVELLGADFPHFCLKQLISYTPKSLNQRPNELFDAECFSRGIGKLYHFMKVSDYVSMKWFPEEFQMLRNHLISQRQGAGMKQLQAIFGNITFIHLIRQNTARQAISLHISHYTGQFHKSQRDYRPHADVPYDFDEIYKHHQLLQKDKMLWVEIFEELGVEPLTFIYEEMLADYDSVIRPLSNHLSYPLIVPRPETLPSKPTSSELNEAFLSQFRADLAERDSPLASC